MRTDQIPRVKLFVIGGFLGAGKTTSILRMARLFADDGYRVGVITNDQSDKLVDTQLFRAAGISTEEVPNGCFCCRFDELVAVAERLADEQQAGADGRRVVLFAEPVGSCTDLVATVIKPMRRLFGERFHVGPYVALLDPLRAFEALAGTGAGALSAKVTYLFKMQQQEADVVAINKIDLLSKSRLVELNQLVHQSFPKAQVLSVSAKSGDGFHHLMACMGQRIEPRSLAIDYDTYADAEAALRWLDAVVDGFVSGGSMDAELLAMRMLETLRGRLPPGDSPGHIKLNIHSDGELLVTANLVGEEKPTARVHATKHTSSVTVTLNARVETRVDLEMLFQQVLESIDGIRFEVRKVDQLTPPRPQPLHRDAGG